MKPKVQLPAFLRCDSDPVVSEISESGELTKALLQGKSNGTKDQDILDNFSTEALAGALAKKLSAKNAGGEGISGAEWLSDSSNTTLRSLLPSLAFATMRAMVISKGGQNAHCKGAEQQRGHRQGRRGPRKGGDGQGLGLSGQGWS